MGVSNKNYGSNREGTDSKTVATKKKSDIGSSTFTAKLKQRSGSGSTTGASTANVKRK